VLYWTTGEGWSVGNKDFLDGDLIGAWEGFDLEDTLVSNGFYFIEED